MISQDLLRELQSEGFKETPALEHLIKARGTQFVSLAKELTLKPDMTPFDFKLSSRKAMVSEKNISGRFVVEHTKIPEVAVANAWPSPWSALRMLESATKKKF